MADKAQRRREADKRHVAEKSALRLLAAMCERGQPIFTADTPLGRSLTKGQHPQPIFLTPEAVNKLDIVVCVPCDDDHPLMLLDNEVGDCLACGRRVQHRPEIAKGAALHCIECALACVGKGRPDIAGRP